MDFIDAWRWGVMVSSVAGKFVKPLKIFYMFLHKYDQNIVRFSHKS